MRRWLLGATLALGSVAAGSAFADGCGQIQIMTAQAIEGRLVPPGAGAVTVGAKQVAASQTPGSPEDIYNAFCVVCHDAGVAGAPKLGDAAAWGPRINKGMDTLLEHVVNGFGAMPPKGTCMSCTEDDLHATIEYMIAQ